ASDSISSTGLGILAQNNSGGSFTFSGSKTLSTGTNDAVTLTSNGGDVAFTGGGLAITTTGTGRGLVASGGGTLAVTGSGNTIATVNGAALELSGVNTGAGNLAFDAVSAGNAATAVSLANVGGSGSLTVGGGVITGGSGARISVSGGDLDVPWAGSVSQNGAGALVSVAGNHTGTLTFGTGTLSATAGTGLQFNDADGTYAFLGVTTLNGGDAGVDITNGSGGTFTFGTGVAITSPTGTAFNVNGSTPANVTYSGNLTKANAGLLADVSELASGTVTFQTGTLNATAGDGIQLSNADGTVSFNGTTTLNGGNAGVDVIGGTGGTISFAAGTSITNPTGPALFVDASAPTSLTYAGSISTGPASGRPVHIEDLTAGTGSITVSGAIGSTGQGILVQNITAGTHTIAFSAAKTLSTGGNAAVALDNVDNATVNFTGGSLGITTTTGAGFSAINGGTVNVTGASNTVSTGTGTALNLANVTVGASNLVFAAVSSVGATNAVVLNTVTGTGSINVAGGAITGAAGGAAFVVTGGSADASWAGSITQAANNALVSISGGHNGDITFSGTVSATNGTGLQFDNADGNYDFTGSHALNNTVPGGNAGVDILNGSSGDFAFNGNVDITNPTGPALFVDASAPVALAFQGDISTGAGSGRPVHIEDLTGGTITVSGPISSTGQGILVQNNTSGTPSLTFSGTKSLSTGTNAAFTLDNNDAATINVGTATMNLTTTSGAGFRAVNGGTVNVTGTTNDASSTTGIAVEVSNTTIGGSGVRFRSVSANGGANGIVLISTGNVGGNFFEVTGTAGTNGSGGTIQNSTGGDGAQSGNGVYLSSTRNVRLNWMALSGTANNGIFGTSVTNLTVDHVRLTGNHGTNNGGDPTLGEESPVHLVNSGGAIKITNSRLDGGAWNGFTLRNTSAVTVDSLVLDTDSVTTMQGSLVDGRNTGLQALFYAGTADVRIRNSQVSFWWGSAIHVVAEDASAVVSRIQNNTTHQTSGALAGASGIVVSGGNLQYLISGNSVRGSNGTAISADKQDFTTHMRGTIDGNFVGASGVANSGSGTGIGIFASHIGPNVTTVKISNNTIRQINGSANGAITLLTGDDVGGGGAGTINATITGNNIQESGTVVNNAQQGILVTHGRVSGDSDLGCYDIGGAGGLANVITNFNTAAGGSNVNRIRINERFVTTARFPGYTGANNDNNAMTTYLMTRNTFSNGAHNNNVSVGGAGFLNTVPAGSACTQPPAL
ncbi:MAG TPA: hypothetical protein VFX98_16675, partial [Longimicrobiaceae bacterium]|nr:hypothetical protein [Longimicrobiaceae bacterium]